MFIHPGSTLRVLRERRNLTREQAAAALGVSETTLDGWENDRSRPPVRLEAKIISVLATNYEEYLLVWFTEVSKQSRSTEDAGA